jgi:hypothetical protein
MCLLFHRFNVNGDGECHKCIEGAICPGGSQVLSAYGYWQDPAVAMTEPLLFVCTGQSCCDQNTGCTIENTCTGNTTGPLCSLCVNEKDSRWSDDCRSHA